MLGTDHPLRDSAGIKPGPQHSFEEMAVDSDNLTGFAAVLLSWVLVAIGFFWVAILPVVGLMYLCGFLR